MACSGCHISTMSSSSSPQSSRGAISARCLMCMVVTTPLRAVYRLPSAHSMPTQRPCSMMSCSTGLLVSTTPSRASMYRPNASASMPEPPLGIGRPPKWPIMVMAWFPVPRSLPATPPKWPVVRLAACTWGLSQICLQASYPDSSESRCQNVPSRDWVRCAGDIPRYRDRDSARRLNVSASFFDTVAIVSAVRSGSSWYTVNEAPSRNGTCETISGSISS